MDITCYMREENFHNNDEILALGEISDKLYFVTQGQVGVYVSTSSDIYTFDQGNEEFESDQSILSSGSHTNDYPDKDNFERIGILNIGSNFNHLSAILSQQSILTFIAMGPKTQLASITKSQFN